MMTYKQEVGITSNLSLIIPIISGLILCTVVSFYDSRIITLWNFLTNKQTDRKV